MQMAMTKSIRSHMQRDISPLRKRMPIYAVDGISIFSCAVIRSIPGWRTPAELQRAFYCVMLRTLLCYKKSKLCVRIYSNIE